MHPGHPLLLAITDLLLERHSNLLHQGTILVDPSDEGETPHLLFLLTHELRAARANRFPSGCSLCALRPTVRLPLPAGLRISISTRWIRPTARCWTTCWRPWLCADQERRALALAADTLVPEHYAEVAQRRIAQVDKTLAAVHERLTKEIDYWTDRWIKLKEDAAAGKPVVYATIDNFYRTVQELQARLENRKRELKAQRQVVRYPIALGGALVVPKGCSPSCAQRCGGSTQADAATVQTGTPSVRAAANTCRRPGRTRASSASPWMPCAG